MKNLLIVLMFPTLMSGTSFGQIIYKKDWNTGTLGQGLFVLSCITPNNPGFLTDSFSTAGDYAVYTSVSKDDSLCGGSNRTEFNITAANYANVEWQYWETYVPPWVPNDSRAFSSGQIHGSVNVPFSLWFVNGNLEAHIQNSTTNSSGNLTTNATFPCGAYKRGAWQKNLIHFKRSMYSDGFIEMWINGEFKFRYNGPTADVIGGVGETAWYWKSGLYHWFFEKSIFYKKAIATDNWIAGGPSAVYTDFFPAAPLPPDPPPTQPTNTVTLPWNL